MIIEQYGIKLIRLTEDDIELVRQMRNLPRIRKTMAYRKTITKSMQRKWFDSINNPLNYYFIIEWQGQKIGVINSKNINVAKGYGEGGIFIWEENLSDEFVTVLASLCLLNTVFFELQIVNKTFVQILQSNTRSQFYNSQLGYVKIPGQGKKNNPYYILTKEDYTLKSKKLNDVAAKLYPAKQNLLISGELSPRNLEQVNQYFRNKYHIQ
jgi:UDP-4-amino-4,6-dideoxy-N-acetyl-beta-L-altrosamine N-acetyltransferase